MGRRAAMVMVMVLAACGPQAERADRAEPEAPEPPLLPEVTGQGMVLENGEHGPGLCFSYDASHPPGCRGFEVRGWDWTAVPEAERAGAHIWINSVEVTGRWDQAAEVLTLTRPPRVVPEAEQRAAARPFFPLVCPEPAGGWRGGPAPDPAVEAYALAQPDLSGFWVGRDGLDPSFDKPPAVSVTHVRVTADVERHRAAIEAVAQGDVCVLEGGSPRSEIHAAAEALQPGGRPQPPVILALTDESAGHVLAFVTFDDGTLQRAYDERFGPGVVKVAPNLRLVDQ